MSKLTLNPTEYEITDGYVGRMGKTFATATEATLAEATEAAAKRNKKSVEDIERSLAVGVAVAWCDSPNSYYDHSVGVIRRKRNLKPIELVECSCGHSVPEAQVMSASLGSSCPDCYDKMSN